MTYSNDLRAQIIWTDDIEAAAHPYEMCHFVITRYSWTFHEIHVLIVTWIRYNLARYRGACFGPDQNLSSLKSLIHTPRTRLNLVFCTRCWSTLLFCPSQRLSNQRVEKLSYKLFALVINCSCVIYCQDPVPRNRTTAVWCNTCNTGIGAW